MWWVLRHDSALLPCRTVQVETFGFTLATPCRDRVFLRTTISGTVESNEQADKISALPS